MEWKTTTWVIDLVFLVCASVLFCGCDASQHAGVGPLKRRRGRGTDNTRMYTRAFWGVLKIQQEEMGWTPVLVKCQSIVGKQPGNYAMPLDHFACTPRPFKATPLEYVAGRRYLVFVGSGAGADTTAVRQGGEAVLEIIDLDQSRDEARAVSLFTRPARMVAFPTWPAETAGPVGLDKWYADVKQRIASRRLTPTDVATTLGEPDRVKVTKSDVAGPEITATYVLNAHHFTEVKPEHGSVTRKCPRLTFTAKHGRITSVRRDDYVETVVHDVEGIRD